MINIEPFHRRIPFLFALSCFTFSLLSFEIITTRIFSLFFLYHYAFLIVSTSLLGIGIGAVLWYAYKKRFKVKENKAFLPIIVFIYSLLLVITLIIVKFVNVPTLFVFAIIILLPFLCAGVFLSAVYDEYSALSPLLYGADLIGASFGSLCIVLLIEWTGVLTSLLCSAVFGFFTGIILSLIIANKKLLFIELSLWSITFCLVLLNPYWNINNLDFTRPMFNEKRLFEILQDSTLQAEIVATKWTALGRVDLVETQSVDEKFIFTDGVAPAIMYHYPSDKESKQKLQKTILYFPFEFGNKETVLDIGSGAGLDVLMANLAGSKKVVAVEVNPAIIEFTNRFRDFTGDIYQKKGVELYIDEGRNFIQRVQEKFDIIFLSLVQTGAAEVGGSALIEDYIFTKEAFHTYLDHLKYNGRIVIFTHNSIRLTKLFTTALTVLEERNISLPAAVDHLIIAEDLTQSAYRYCLILRNHPFSVNESQEVDSLANSIGVKAYFVPHVIEEPPISFLSKDNIPLDDFIQLMMQSINAIPATDDSPHFFNPYIIIPPFLLNWFLIAASIGIFIFIVPLFIANRKLRRPVKIRLFKMLVYFSLLGTAFMLVEISLIRKLILYLGNPIYALSIILFVYLLSGGIGSLCASYVFRNHLKRFLLISVFCIMILILCFTLTVDVIFSCLLTQQFYTTFLVTVMILFPLGFFMGIPFPGGILIVKKLLPKDIPIMYGVNGIFSVIGSFAAVLISLMSGFSFALLFAAFCYLITGIIIYFINVKINY